MKVVAIQDIKRKEVPLYYRREFTGTAVLEIFRKNFSSPVDFVIEQSPLGKSEVRVSMKKDPDYPIIPVMRNLKTYITELDKSGKLPL